MTAKWRWGSGAAGLLAVLVGLAVVNRPRPPAGLATLPPVAVSVETVAPAPLVRTMELSGVLQPVDRVDLSAGLPAKVLSVPVKEGQRVAAGAVLITLDGREVRANLNKAAAGLANAEAQLEKARAGLTMSGALSTVRVDQARTGVRTANQGLAGAQKGYRAGQDAARAQVEQAQGALAAAQAALAQARCGAALSGAEAARDERDSAAALQAALADQRRAEQGANLQATAAQAEVERAEAGVAAAQADLDRVAAGASSAELEAAQANERAARIGRDAAKAALDDLEFLHARGGVSGADLEQARTGYGVAQAQLDAAQAQLRGAREGASPAQRAAAESQLAGAKAALKQAQAGLGRGAVSQAEVEAARAAADRARAGAETAAAAKAERLALADAQVEAARANVTQAAAGLKAAQAGLTGADARQAEVAAARGSLAQAQAGLREAEVGRDESRVRSSDVAAAQAGLQAALADYRLASEQVGKTSITAPVAGRLTRLSAQPGATAMPGMPLATIESESAAELVCLVSGSQRAALRPGQKATVAVEGVDGRRTATVGSVARSAEADGRTFSVRLVLDGSDLPPGARARCQVQVDHVNNALSVPLATVRNLDGAEPYVLVERAGQADRRPVTLGLRTDQRVQVVSGLAAGERVVVAGADNLQPGSAVQVR